VVVTNFNYAQYLDESIRSALSQNDIEVIVVDDGSTDGSREVIGRYGERVHAILKPNGGQASAMNAGFRASSGEVVLFLDSDDFLHDNAVERLRAVYHRPCAKVHWRLTVADAAGHRFGAYPPGALRAATSSRNS
jgi:glycosyltransferase involved in cell wall biosynthesis